MRASFNELLKRNCTPHGILAASLTDAAVARRYTRIFGRDAGVCVLAMAGSGVPQLERGAIASGEALAAQQAANGQIPKYVDPKGATPMGMAGQSWNAAAFLIAKQAVEGGGGGW